MQCYTKRVENCQNQNVTHEKVSVLRRKSIYAKPTSQKSYSNYPTTNALSRFFASSALLYGQPCFVILLCQFEKRGPNRSNW
mmetsp:Transcript_18620/g.26505  ORF Transcript_18620/g.26505 Transcript_18620/m.26505 type:complete len:82 (+) Transcript_18620:245-490(+)